MGEGEVSLKVKVESLKKSIVPLVRAHAARGKGVRGMNRSLLYYDLIDINKNMKKVLRVNTFRSCSSNIILCFFLNIGLVFANFNKIIISTWVVAPIALLLCLYSLISYIYYDYYLLKSFKDFSWLLIISEFFKNIIFIAMLLIDFYLLLKSIPVLSDVTI